MTLRACNAALHVLHLAVIGFSILGWIWPGTRPWHLALAAGIATSWFVIGPLRGEPGYCVVTGAQHAVWRRLCPEAPRPGYMVYLAERLLGRPAPPGRVAWWTQAVFYTTTALSVALAFATRPSAQGPGP